MVKYAKYMFQWLLSWLLHKQLFVINLSLENNLPTFQLNAAVVISTMTTTAQSIQLKCWQVIF